MNRLTAEALAAATPGTLSARATELPDLSSVGDGQRRCRR